MVLKKSPDGLSLSNLMEGKLFNVASLYTGSLPSLEKADSPSTREGANSISAPSSAFSNPAERLPLETVNAVEEDRWLVLCCLRVRHY